jgi:hypothetical protein
LHVRQAERRREGSGRPLAGRESQRENQDTHAMKPTAAAASNVISGKLYKTLTPRAR